MSAYDPLRTLQVADIFAWMTDAQKGCGITASIALLVAVALYAAFTDASSRQSAQDCVTAMRGPILLELAKFPDTELKDKGAVVEHVLYGNEQETVRLAAAFANREWTVAVEPMDEIGWGAILTEDAVRFRAIAIQRIEQLCAIAERRHVEYRTWRLHAPGLATHVSQREGQSKVLEQLPSE